MLTQMGAERRYTAFALPLALCASLSTAALGQGETNEALARAREGMSLSRRERELAAELLQQWRYSEEVAPGTGDPSLGRALESIARGRALAPDEVGSLRRYETKCRGERLKAAERGLLPGIRDAPRGGRRSASSRDRRGPVSWWFVPAAGAAVVILGAAWMLAARAFRGR